MLYLNIGRAANTGLGSDSRADEVELPQPHGHPVPTGAVLVHNPSLATTELIPRGADGMPPLHAPTAVATATDVDAEAPYVRAHHGQVFLDLIRDARLRQRTAAIGTGVGSGTSTVSSMCVGG